MHVVVTVLEDTDGGFRRVTGLVERDRPGSTIVVDRAAIEDQMMTSYRALRRSQRERLRGLDDVDVTFSRDLLLLRPTRHATILA